MKNGNIFHEHYTNATACVPARTTLQTGTYPLTHKVTSTNGVAKKHGDTQMKWLEKNFIPTIGNYLRSAGYQTYLKGKWHISDADLYDEFGELLATYDANGNRLLNGEKVYLDNNVLYQIAHARFGMPGHAGVS